MGCQISWELLATPDVLTNGLVAHLSFSSNFKDDSPNGNDGGTTNVTFGPDRFGIPNSAAVFNGTDSQVAIKAGTPFNLFPVTVAAWVLSANAQSADCGIVSDYFGSSGNGWGLFANGSRLRSWYYGLKGSVRSDFLNVTNTGPTRWRHLAATYDNTGGKLFLDGALVVSHDWIGAPSASTTTQSLLVGENRSADGSHQNFKGSIDEVRIYGRALSPAEIGEVYGIESTPPAPRRATGTAQVVNGFVVGVTVSDPGFGYTTPPLVAFVGGGGTGASAVATSTNGVVTGVMITSAGAGYTSIPVVKIASPPFIPTVSIATSKVKVTQNVVLGQTYLLESSKDLVSWSPVGEPYVAKDEPTIVELDVSEVGQFFRITQVQ